MRGIDADYLLRKLRGEVAPEITEVEQTLTALRTQVCGLIAGLWWKDFELLTDLIFSKAGWQRFSVLGETEKDIDIDAYAPTTQRRAFIQIKSQTNRHEAKKYIDTFRSYDDFDEMFFVYHTATEDLSDLACKDGNVHLWGIEDIAALVINSGLLSWLINKRR
ncbi:restriction endonuclease [Pseudomonas sp. LS-2]|uniref:restriction endonuclease n=1 Tax=Pseudomonas sp. LS-2 TaxID=2315859 RepID=UPI001C49C0B4|nr:restriction endonuclease [Pseudomonas sp. LS-2]